ncbi:zinc finger CCHC domain-containing protein 9 [Mastacembelus armatus]|uniref:zinc finger CCHC domain-containing protein 9 n=1 Tax=Mastacembelus armatus TaxID=205130 RepID=UPI000E464CD3|nr:zinc finger CCHC domain-containing protein 9-like [Mastacembelus armatus]
MRNLLSPEKPKDKTYQQLVLLLKDHFDPKPSEIVQRFKFDSRMRKPNESVTEFVAELRHLAQDCNYGGTLQQMLRDRIVCGINDERIQRRLLAEENLTFEKALSIAVSVEAANKNAQDLQNPNTSVKCFKVNNNAEAPGAKGESAPSCYRCNGTKHVAAECKFKHEKCHACGKIGHIARACRNKSKATHRGDKKRAGQWHNKKQAIRHRTHKVERNTCENSSASSDEDTVTLGCLTYRLGKMKEEHLRSIDPYSVRLKINGKVVAFEIDTGCSLSIMSIHAYRTVWDEIEQPPLEPVGVKLETYTGHPVKVVGAA